MFTEDNFVTMTDLFLAYRKAKVEAFYESTQFHAMKFSQYEEKLEENLGLLRKKIFRNGWQSDLAFIGHYYYIPKSLDDFEFKEKEVHYCSINPTEDWVRCFNHNKKNPARAGFRLVISPSVEFQIVSALWILKAGYKFDEIIDDDHSYGNRLRKHLEVDELGDYGWRINKDAHGLFSPYYSAYKKWRENGLASMKDALREGGRILAVTMDVKGFYHNVNPRFLLRESFLKRHQISLSKDQRKFTSLLIEAMEAWYRSTPDSKENAFGALPVGLSASKIISNVLLAELDAKVVKELSPIYYGRYVDDIFLVLRGNSEVFSGIDFMRWLSKELRGFFVFQRGDSERSPSLKLRLPYARDSSIEFSGAKQKIFDLHAAHGMDLVAHIEEQIREQSSEHRLLPILPETDTEMARRALLSTPDATLDADALRKADVVSLRRLGFSLLLRDAECYARELSPDEWRQTRSNLYGLTKRYILSPQGFFGFGTYLPRIFGLMFSCKEYELLEEFINDFKSLILLIKRTTYSGGFHAEYIKCCLKFFENAFFEVGLQATTVAGFSYTKKVAPLLNAANKIGSRSDKKNYKQKELADIGRMLLFSDWGRRPYKHYWYFETKQKSRKRPIPDDPAIRRLLRLKDIQYFRKYAELKVPFWPALAFPTRPPSFSEIGLISPGIFERRERVVRSLLAMRGAKVKKDSGHIGFVNDENRSRRLNVPFSHSGSVLVALSSYETKKSQWDAAVKEAPDLSYIRYQDLRRLVNQMLVASRRPNYITFPECSIPRQWAISIAHKLSQNGVSFICGVEPYRSAKDGLMRNNCLLSLCTKWPGYLTSFMYMQPKLRPAFDEAADLMSIGKALYEPVSIDDAAPVYSHGTFFFAVLLCSDLTAPENRLRLQGEIDSLFVLEWNPDV